ncbi:MAG: class I SAM-dependent methyltransferase [Desulfovibrio sp.]|jgi:SAM-dependent methyltransferase|nr:class I SAM-dependent methyltransferase [Desulfovibrio sp.]
MLAETPLDQMSFSRMVCAQLVGLVAAFAAPGARILDFGGGGGELAQGLLRAGFKVGVYEPSEGRSGQIRAKEFALHKNWLGFFDAARLEQFDVVCAFEVLEHFLDDNLTSDMALMVRFCAPEGKVIGTVPLEEDLNADLCLCPECAGLFHKWQHQRSFNHESLTAMLRCAGLACCRAFAVNFSIRLGFAAGFGEFQLPDCYMNAPQTLHQCLAAERQKVIALERQTALLTETEQALGKHNLDTLKEHACAAKVLGYALRRLDRLRSFFRAREGTL